MATKDLTRAAVLDAMLKWPGIRHREIATKVGISKSAAQRHAAAIRREWVEREAGETNDQQE